MITSRLTVTFRDRRGNKHIGLLTDPEDRFDGDIIRSRRILRVNPGTPLKNGDVVSDGKSEYLLFEHSTYRYVAYMVTNHYPWERASTVQDPVSLMKETGVYVLQDKSVPTVVEFMKMDQVRGFERAKYLLRAGGDFQVGDHLGPYEIYTVKNVLGACVMEAFEYGSQ